jgi:cytidine deaminase
MTQMPTPEALMAAAESVAAKAYAPYSRFHVGAALLCEDGTIISGCNVENASYGLTICAERNAIGRAIAEGKQRFVAVAITQGQEEPCYPCGACRQVLWEFAPDLILYFRGTDGTLITHTMRELLPHGFDKSRLI